MSTITTIDQLRSIYKVPSERSVLKELTYIDPHIQRFISLSPFLVISSGDQQHQMDSSPRGGDEFEHAKLEKLPSRKVKPMRVARSPIQFECVYLNTLRFPGEPPFGTADVVFGKVVAIHIDDEMIDGKGMLDVLKMKPLARMGYYDYTSVDNKFEMIIGGDNKALLVGLEGSPDKAKTALGS